jgi:hypothetical protein
MPRKIETITIEADGRDKGKKFIVTEMPADQGIRWATRALLALTNTGAAVPEEALTAGWAGLAAIGIQAIGMLPYEKVQPMIEEAISACVTYEHSPKFPPRKILEGSGGDIEEVKTYMTLYTAVFKLHTGFSLAVEPPTSAPEQGEEKPVGWLTQMSRALLGLLYRHALRP